MPTTTTIPDGPAKVMLDGFEVARENHHNFANGLKWGPDGWLYGRCGGSFPARIGLPEARLEETRGTRRGLMALSSRLARSRSPDHRDDQSLGTRLERVLRDFLRQHR